MPNPIVVASLNGRVVLQVDAGPVVTRNTGTSFDRLELWSSNGGKRYVVDSTAPLATINSITIQTQQGQLTQVRFSAHVRCYISRPLHSKTRFHGVLVPDGTWLKFSQVSVELQSSTNQTIAALETLEWEFLNTPATLIDVPLFEALGLDASRASRIAVSFAAAPRSASEDQISRPPSQTIRVLQFSRAIALNSQRQRLAVDTVWIELSRETIEAVNLDGPLLTEPIRIVQLPLVLTDDNDQLNQQHGPVVIAIEGLPTWPVLDAWNHAIAIEYLGALQTVQDGRPISLLPQFDLPPWPLTGTEEPVSPVPTGVTLSDCNQLRWAVMLQVDRDVTPANQNINHHDDYKPGKNIALHFRAATPLPPPNDEADRVHLRFQAMLRHDDTLTPLSVPWALRRTFDRVSGTAQAVDADLQGQLCSIEHGFVIRARQLFYVGTDDVTRDLARRRQPQRVRLGALDLEFDPEFRDFPLSQYTPSDADSLEEKQSLLRAGFRRPRALSRDDLPQSKLRVLLRVNRLMPGGQDGLPDESFNPGEQSLDSGSPPCSLHAITARFRREAPVTIPLDIPAAGPFTIVATESTAAQQSHLLAVQVFERSDETAPLLPTTAPSAKFRLVVIDRQPLLIAQVEAPTFRGLAGADGNREVGNWSSSGFEGASWELAGASDGFRLSLPPQSIGEGMEKRVSDTMPGPTPNGTTPDVRETFAAPFRLGPPAHLRLASSYFRQNFTEAAWNLRRILGYPGQRAPGAQAFEMQFELLYGLGCEVRVPGIRVAELTSRLGAVPKSLPTDYVRHIGREYEVVPVLAATFARHRCDWSQIFAAWLSRLGILEPWSEAITDTLTLTWDDGVRYELRNPRQITLDPADPFAANPNDDLLPGGALWGLSFRSQHEAFLAPGQLRGVGGELSRLAFSSMGGWGYQKAVFLRGLTTIYSDTAMGRAFFYSVEQKGRIAGFWNYAKHVVIYERTVAPTAQFVSQQDHLAGRPVVRKVREFVEILQPTRTYPDFRAAPITNGCVLGIEFKSKIIPVDAAWGRDVLDAGGATKGYVIPLWRAGENPAIYPKPQVAIRLAGAEAETATIAAELDEPQKLYFYAEPGAVTADTDQWLAVLNVDFPDLEWPTAPVPRPDPAADLDATQPNESSVHAGYDAYTYGIVNSRPVNVVASRARAPLGAVLRNITMVRSEPAPVDSAPNLKIARSELVTAQQRLNELVELIPAAGDVSAKLAGIESRLRDIESDIKGAAIRGANEFGLLSDLTVRKWLDDAKQSLTRWRSDATTSFEQEFLQNLVPTIRRLDPAPSIVSQAATQLLQEQLQQFKLRVLLPDAGAKELIDCLGKAEAAVRSTLLGLNAQVEASRRELLTLVATSASAIAAAAARELSRPLKSRVRDLLQHSNDQVVRFFKDLPHAFRTAIVDLEHQIDLSIAQIIATPTAATINSELNHLATEAQSTLDDLLTDPNHIHALRAELLVRAGRLFTTNLGGVTLQPIINGLDSRLTAAMTGGTPEQLAQSLADGVISEIRTINAAVDTILTTGLVQLTNLMTGATGLENIPGLLKTVVPGDINAYFNSAAEWGNKITAAITALRSGSVDQARSGLNELTMKARGTLDDLAARLVGPIAAAAPNGISQQSGNVLRLIRAFGAAPQVAGLAFSREQIGYFYDPLKRLTGDGTLPVDITPVNALVNRVGAHLKATGLRLPTGQLLDQILPPPDELLKQFDLGKLLPDFAGLKLDKLFPELKAPASLKDKVKITQQFDRQSGSGWVQADVRIPEDGPTILFDAGPIRVEVSMILLTATIRIEADASGGMRRTQSGKLSADWQLTVGGEKFITFADTALTFDQNGKTKFDLDPSKVRLNGVMQMLSDAFASLSSPEDGFTLALKEENGMPVGVEAALVIPLPDVSAGPCGLSNLRFGAHFELVAVPEFAIGVRTYVSRRLAPFTVTVFILGGGGWIDVRSRYLPFSGRITTALSIGISAGAKLAIAFGPIKGSVAAYFFIEAEMATDSATPGTQLTIGIGIVLTGEVDVLGIISVNITLMLLLQYSAANGMLIGTGSVSIRVKVCWFFTISVNQEVRKEFARVGGSNRVAFGSPLSAVQLYLSLIE